MTWLSSLRLGLIALVVLGVAPLADAQVLNTGTIEVLVEDADGGRIPGATVTAIATDTVTRRTVVTDGEGVATLDAMAPSALYVVTVELQGFQNQVRDGVLVRAGQTASVRFTLSVAGVAESVSVTAEAPLVDVKSAITGQDITLQLTESLPTGRSYQSYLQLVPGVMPDDQTQSGNPASRSGMNYSDIGGDVGISTDNVYYFDAINVTDPVTGTFGANLNTEIIQEQKVITGGIPAEFVGASGLISSVVTKSGSNTFHGSANYFFQNTNLVAENKNSSGQEFSTDDSAFTIGGPVLRDRLWFFGSYRYVGRSDDVTALDTNEFLRSVKQTQHQGFAKGTWAPTRDDLISFTYLGDPTHANGRRDRDVTNARDYARDQGGHRFAGNYTRVWGDTLVEVVANKHNGEVTNLSAIRQPRLDVLYFGSDSRTLSDEQGGGYGRDLIDQRDNMAYRGTVQHTFGNHTVKGGFGWEKHSNFRDTLYVDNVGAYPLAAMYAGRGITAADLASGAWSNLQFDVTATSDFQGFINAINSRPDRAAYYAAFDTNGDGTITPPELGAALTFTTVNNGYVNYDRDSQVSTGPQDTYSHGMTLFAQDQVTFDRLTLNLGVRGERWSHFATTGDNIFTFEWAWAPRLSAVYDLLGDGRQKASFYYGRYYDPIRNDMTNFAGTLTGSVIEEQVFALGNWVTYRTRGGPSVQDAFFSPTTKTPYTDDIEVGYAIDLGNNMSFDATYYKRRTRNVMEDFDLGLYGDPDGYINLNGTQGDVNAPNSLFLGYDYFGYSSNPASNFVIGTLKGAERNFQGLEFVFRKRFSNNWQVLSSYNWSDGKGNSNSDGNADFQGDVIYLDPRAPNVYGTQPGLIRHLVKGAGSYSFPFGLQLGATFNWNSGTVGNRSFLASSRHLPVRVGTANAFEYGGITQNWVAPGSVGGVDNPSWGQIDLRAQYVRPFGITNLEVFVDIFNIFDNQDPIRTEDLVAGQGDTAFGDPVLWVQPRRAFVGARFRF